MPSKRNNSAPRCYIGNTAVQVEDDRWEWTLYVRGSASKHIERVKATLHPTFRNRVRILKGPKFELTATGWGTFDIDVRIKWASGAVTTTVWELQFHGGDMQVDLTLPSQIKASVTTSTTKDAAAGGDTSAAAAAAAAAPPPPAAAAAATGTARSLQAELDQVTGTKLVKPSNAAQLLVQPGDAYKQRLKKAPFLSPGNVAFFHGRAFGLHSGNSETAFVSEMMAAPTTTWTSCEPPRDDHDAPEWLTASEYQDSDAVLEAKCAQLATLLKASKKTVAYTGAGISASVIGQAARSGANTVGWKANLKAAPPTLTHHALGLLGREGLLHSWVQQNHDGLPQKAGFPQEMINEIHGSWYDPSNPVVKYSGSLHEKCYPWMREDAETADLVLVLGTSLGGLNADQVATRATSRSLKGDSLGTVMINLQQTEHDGKMTLRFNGKSDDVLACLLRHLELPLVNAGATVWPQRSRVLVPYNSYGERVSDSSTQKMWLDFRDGAKVKITDGHNIQGSGQPAFLHIGHSRPGHGKVFRRDDETSAFTLVIEGVQMTLGIWWLDAAERGAVEKLPVVNLNPEYE